MEKQITISIDGRSVIANKGDNLLKVALDNGFDIPNLCYNRKITPTAACRLCLVKIEGIKGFVTSCNVTISEGMEVTSTDNEIEQLRRSILDMILSTHNDDCISCVKDGDCQLQDLAFKYNLAKEDRKLKPIWSTLKKYSDNSSYVLDYDATRCIQCERCVKACSEIQGKGVISSINRGIHSQVVTGFHSRKDSECDGCGECVQMCPVGALTNKPIYSSIKRLREKDIDKRIQTTCPFCGVGCQLDVSIKNDNIVKVDGVDEIPNYGKTCVKGRYALDFVKNEKRIKTPLIKKNGKFVSVSFEEAIAFSAKKLAVLKKKHGSDAIAGLSSARCTNEENFVFQKFMRAVIGTNNVDHCARLCHASTVAGLATTLGSGAMTNSIAEIEFADVILVTGSNTTETHPVIATLIKRAVLFNDAKLIVVDPRKIDLVKYATLWLRQNNGSDVAWVNGFINVIIGNKLQDKSFINKRTEGFEELKEIVSKYSPEKVEEYSGIPASKLIEAAKLYASAGKASIIYSMGITQHATGTNNVKSMANLSLLTGNLGKKSAGVNPLRGQNNVQGACDLGALPNVYPGYQKVTDAAAQKKFEKAWGVPLSNSVGLTVTEILNGACKGTVKALYIMGENPMVSDPNITHVKKALESLDFIICQDIFMNETTQFADVVFPAASFAEKEGAFTNTERRILPIHKLIAPLGDSKPDWEIVQAIATAMGFKMNYQSIKDILDEINILTPQYTGITYDRIMNGEKLQWPCPTKDHPGTKYLHKDQFARGKGLFTALEYEPPKETPCDEYPFVMSTGRNLFHYHTGTMTRKTTVLPQFNSGPYVEMNKEDLLKLNVQDGDDVKVSTRRGTIITTALETSRVIKGNVFIPFHFAEAAANMLTNDVIDPIAKIPELKVCSCRIEPVKKNIKQKK